MFPAVIGVFFCLLFVLKPVSLCSIGSFLAFFPMKREMLTVSFFPSLLVLLRRILNTTLFESWEIVGPYPSWWVFNLLLILLQLLHSFWSYLIVKTVCRAISKGKVSHRTARCFKSITMDGCLRSTLAVF